jgi:Uma2 family endonuclease
MNIAVLSAAEDLPPRRAFTVADVHRMVEAGIIAEDERLELIGGEFFVMAAKGYAHELIKNALIQAMVRAKPADVWVAVEMTIQFSQDVLLEPDITVFPRANMKKSDAGFVTFAPGGCSLVVAVAASSLGYDKRLKAPLYASLGVREFWVIDANQRITWVHSNPHADGWASIVERGPDDTLSTPSLPAFSIRLGEIE